MAKHTKNGRRNKKGTKKGDKIHGTKKGKKGEAAAHMTRAQALAKLQLPLADFRKLCILKGIYPRDPKKKSSGADKTYYHHKDISFLLHEPLLNKFFELKTFMKKFKRLMGRKETELAKGFEDRKPQYTLHHLLRERYPSFEDAVRDLDDAVSMLALFHSLSADQKRDIPTSAVNEATRLYQEWQLYVIRSQSLRKVFASIKGYYFQAEIAGQPVTWLSPHQFAQDLPEEVDFRVMLTFLEFYRAAVKFVNFKLFADLGIAYPPERNLRKDSAGAEVACLELEMKEAGKAREAQAQKVEEEDAEVANTVAQDFGEQSKEAVELQLQIAATNRMKTAFRGLRVFINREVPLRPIYFTLLCGGATAVGWERGASSSGSAFKANNDKITHHIIDRPPQSFERIEGREYVQPQWVFDSFNTGCLMPVHPYAPGRSPPPHLSPFVDDAAEGYVPRQREILDRVAAEAVGADVVPVANAAGASDGAVGTAEGGAAAGGVQAFARYSEELKAEAGGVWHSEFAGKRQREAGKTKAADGAESLPAADAALAATDDGPSSDEEAEEAAEAAKPTEEEEERLRRKALMPKKHKRLLQRIEYTEKKKADKNATLRKKRAKTEKE